ncbi:probable Xaa-Pro aminopeptidase 3 isoform X1 [Pelobates cultripes]|uniref:Probable Xaa-Pro aminopeptidase 3 isoform X1 n=1 Tax=Pelobates cultripes TaxID=61616 RepID=A0AAD1T0S8_PELCU|nr:probable Xaa-Pro aminopeptidase 3 isoform X1 [Pelobates cultripes]
MRFVAIMKCLHSFMAFPYTTVSFSFLIRKYSTKTELLQVPKRYLGQPSPFTHPHLLKAGEVTPGLTQKEYALRRYKLMSLIQTEFNALGGGTDHAVLFFSNPTVYMTNDIPFPFHQHNDFLYMCGFMEPDSILLLQSKPGLTLPAHTATLYVQKRDATRELWDGPQSGTDGAVALTGVDEALPIEEFKLVLPRMHDEGVTVWLDSTGPAHTFLHSRFLKPLMESITQGKKSVRPTQHLVQKLRLIKSSAEIELMKKAGHISSYAFIQTMHSSKAPVDEAFLYAKFEFECRSRGANILAYPPVVAGGNRANTLHYIKNNQIIKPGEMVLLDGGCEASCYVSDITRTWPVNGRFSAAQQELYEAVLEIQKSCLGLCFPGTSLDSIYHHMLSLLSKKLKDLKIVQKGSQILKDTRRYCPHHVGHYLGMDVHDTPDISRSIPLQSGMIITIEPGIYIHDDDLAAPEKFRGLGIRIEDDVVITEQSPMILSAQCPKEIYDIQQVCGM